MKQHEPDRPTHVPEAPRETVGNGTGYLDSQLIFGDGNEVLIQHGDKTYRLRKTRYGKLILNK